VYSDFKVVEGIIPIDNARTSDLFAAVRVQREIIDCGISAAAAVNSDIETVVRLLVWQNWPKFHPGKGGDRGGFQGHFEKDIDGIVKQVMKPLRAYEKNLEYAHDNLTRFPFAFRRWMAPIARKGRESNAIIIDGGW
jgi:hypothetical protein